MATYAIGDIHGCFATLKKLLKKMPFRPQKDRLWLVGDLVNKGPRSLEVLRWAQEMDRRMGDRFQAVLGNHDLHLLAVAQGSVRPRNGHSLRKILRAPDRHGLLKWLRRRPVLVRDGDYLLLHAGLPPQWSPRKAERRALKIQAMMDSRSRRRLLRRGRICFDPESSSKLDDVHKRRRDLAYLTRLRSCTPRGIPCSFSGAPEEVPAGCLPWFEVPRRKSRDVTVVCGHWAAMGLRLQPGLVALDSGCAWGGGLSAVRLRDLEVYRQKNVEKSFWP